MQQQQLLLVAICCCDAFPVVAAAAEYVHLHLPRFVSEELGRGDSGDPLYAEKALGRAFSRLVGPCTLPIRHLVVGLRMCCISTSVHTHILHIYMYIYI